MTFDGAASRAPGAPELPVHTGRFVLHALRGFGLGYAAMLFFETLAAGSAITTPYALSMIIKAVTATKEQSMTLVDSLTWPLLLFVGLALAEVVFSRIVGALQIRLGPRLRQSVVRSLFHYLQLHSHRYMSSHFAGALAHRVSETAMGTLQILWIIATEFWPIVISITVATVLLFRAHVELGLFSLLWSTAFVICSYALARRSQTYAHRSASARSETTGGIVDSVTNVFSARLFARFGTGARPSEQDTGQGVQGHSGSPPASQSAFAGSSSRRPQCSRSASFTLRCASGAVARFQWVTL